MLKFNALLLAVVTSISMASANEPAKNPTKKSTTKVRTQKRKRATTTMKKKPAPAAKPANDDTVEGGEEGDFSNCR